MWADVVRWHLSVLRVIFPLCVTNYYSRLILWCSVHHCVLVINSSSLIKMAGMPFSLTIISGVVALLARCQADSFIESDNVTNWGTWGKMESCPDDTFAFGFQLLSENPTKDDNTALNGIRLHCRKQNGTSTFQRISSKQGVYGEWRTRYECKQGALTGFQLRVESFKEGSKKADKKKKHDQTATNNIRFQCTKASGDSTWMEGDGNTWGSWGLEHNCPTNYAICGIKTQIEDHQDFYYSASSSSSSESDGATSDTKEWEYYNMKTKNLKKKAERNGRRKRRDASADFILSSMEDYKDGYHIRSKRDVQFQKIFTRAKRDVNRNQNSATYDYSDSSDSEDDGGHIRSKRAVHEKANLHKSIRRKRRHASSSSSSSSGSSDSNESHDRRKREVTEKLLARVKRNLMNSKPSRATRKKRGSVGGQWKDRPEKIKGKKEKNLVTKVPGTADCIYFK